MPRKPRFRQVKIKSHTRNFDQLRNVHRSKDGRFTFKSSAKRQKAGVTLLGPRKPKKKTKKKGTTRRRQQTLFGG